MEVASSSNTDASSKVYQFKVTIRDSKPYIWRRIEVPENYTFYELHISIEDVMEWGGHQWHIFEMGKGANLDIGQWIGIPDDGFTILSEKRERISSRFTLTNKNCVYYHRSISRAYVNHFIKLERINGALPNVRYPRCIAGRQQNWLMAELGIPNNNDDIPNKGRKQRFSSKQITFRDTKVILDSDDSESDE